MLILGLTGPTGSGKTTALEVLSERGFQVVDCDALYYELLRTSPPLRQAIAAAFGDVFLPDGSLDRPGLAKRVFADKGELDRLNAVVYPAMSTAVEQKIQNCSQKGLAIDAINLVESGLDRLCTATVAITAPAEVRLRRIMARDGIPEDRARARIAAQKPDRFYRDRCTYLLENRAGSKAEFKSLLRDFFETLFFDMEVTSDGRETVDGEGPALPQERL